MVKNLKMGEGIILREGDVSPEGRIRVLVGFYGN